MKAKLNFVHELLHRGNPSAPALLHRGDIVSFERLRHIVSQAAALLTDAGLQSGDRVALLADNSLFTVAAYLGTMAAGGTVVPLSPVTQEQHLVYQVESTEAKLGFLQFKYQKRFLETKIGTLLKRVWLDETRGDYALPTGWSIFAADKEDQSAPRTASGPASDLALLATRGGDDDLASIIFTSGSTGTPRGVMVSHRNLLANTRSIVEYLKLTPQDRGLLVLPIYYCYGASVLQTHLWAGGAVAMSNNFMFPEKVAAELGELECTAFYGVPSTYQILLRRTTLPKRSYPKMRIFAQAGGKLPNPFIEELRTAHPAIPYYLMYGQTEATARLSYLPPERLADKLGSIGRGIPGTTLQVLRADGSAVTPGEIGEIVASGENITAGYWRDEQETAAHFRDGKLFTGDLATVDADGFIFVADRARDFIKVGGIRVSSKEVEEVLAALKEIVEVAVIGVPDELLGEAVAAFLVRTPKSTLDENTVMQHCREKLASEKLPKKIFFVDGLPKNEAGKVLKPKIREQYLATV